MQIEYKLMVTLASNGSGELLVKSGGVNTAQLTNNSVTNTATATGSFSTNSSGFTDALSVSYTGTAGSKVILSAFANYVQANSAGQGSIGIPVYRILFNNAVILGSRNDGPSTLTSIVSSIAGTNTFKLQLRKAGDTSVSANDISMYVLEVKK